MTTKPENYLLEKDQTSPNNEGFQIRPLKHLQETSFGLFISIGRLQ